MGGRSAVFIGAILAFAAVSAGANAGNPDGSTVGSGQPTELIVSLWYYNYKTSAFDETRFVLNPMTMTVATPGHSATNFETVKAERRQINVEMYNRLKQQLNEVPAPERPRELVTAIQQIEKARTWGKSPGDQLLASPDGRRLVLRPDMHIPVVVDLTTLRTQQIVTHADLLEIPIAWSGDSRRLAYAPSEAREIVVYDVDEGVVESRLPGFWIQAIAWSPDMKTLAVAALVNRRLYKSTKGLVAAWAGHPDYRNDLILETRTIETGRVQSVSLKLNLDEQTPSSYWVEWH